MRRLTLLSGPAWPLPGAARRWLASEPAYVPLEIVDPASPAARARWPSLEPAAASDDLAVVADDGRLWRGPRAWFVLMWALKSHRAKALRMAQRGGVGSARRFVRARIQCAGTAPPRERSAGGGWTAFRGLLYAACTVPWVVQVVRLAEREPGLAAAVGIVFALLLPTRIGFYGASILLATYLVEPSLLTAVFLFLLFVGIPMWLLGRSAKEDRERPRRREARGTSRS